MTEILARRDRRKSGYLPRPHHFPVRQSPERFRRILVADKAISPELAVAITIQQFGTLVSEVPA
ncbi:MAG: hypothetical protein AB7P12_15305 [Alphaproteobacteria bacterium]